MAETQLIRCASCGATNRVPRENSKAACDLYRGRCKTPLNADQKPATITDTTFAAEVERRPFRSCSTCGRRGAARAGRSRRCSMSWHRSWSGTCVSRSST